LFLDGNGNLSDDGTYLYYYDCENRLRDVNNQNDQPVASYRYDYLGRRIKKTAGGSTTKYCYDGDQVIAEYDDQGTLLRSFVYGPGIDEPICMIDWVGSAVYYYHFDGLGSVIALSDENGDIVERDSYDVFGEPNRVSAVGNPYLFTGRRYDPETGLHYYRARYYSPAIGRFLQPDPMHYIDGLSLYRYVSNNPVNSVDPFGLFGWRGIRDRQSCMRYCRDRRDEHLATAGWLYNLALAAAARAREACDDACDRRFPPGACPSDPLDSNAAACKYLCDTAYHAATSAACAAYMEAVAGAWSQYGSCALGCHIFF